MKNMEELINITPFDKGNPFRVPENYFEEFPDKIMERIHETKIKDVKPGYFLRKFLYPAAAVAAIIVFTLFVINYGNENLNVNDLAENQTDTADAASSFVKENYIIEAITIDEKDTIEGDDIINYLVDDNINENLIADAF